MRLHNFNWYITQTMVLLDSNDTYLKPWHNLAVWSELGTGGQIGRVWALLAGDCEFCSQPIQANDL